MHRSLVLTVSLSVALSGIGASAAVASQPVLGSDHQVARIEHRSLRHLAVGAHVSVDAFALSDGTAVDLDLTRFDVFAPDANIVVGTAAGDRPMPRPEVVLLRGTVAGDEGSRVIVGVSEHGTHGFVRRGGTMHIISTGAFEHAGDQLARVTDLRDAPAGEPFCQVVDDQVFEARPEADGAGDGEPPCRLARIAVDTDWEFTGILFSGDTDASAAYATTLLGAVSGIYEEDLNVTLAISFLRVWDANDDPYSAGGAQGALGELRSHWIESQGQIARELTHLLSGKNLGGGVAYLGQLCSENFGYGVSGNLNGSFPMPPQDHRSGNWDLVVVAHELGHNFGTGHTHSYNPPLDGCGNGDCSDAFGGTIMSYCHLCPGGMTNIAINFHPNVVGVILGYLGGACDIQGGSSEAVADTVYTYQEIDTMLDVLANDEQVSCTAVSISDFDATGQFGGAISLVPAGTDGFPRDRLLYQPATDAVYSDQFHYTIDNGETALVRLFGQSLRDADVPGPSGPGVEVSYYDLPSLDALPDFTEIAPVSTDIVGNVDFASTNGDFATSGMSNTFGAVFEGFVTVPVAGEYTFYTESDDGSALYIGDERVVNNDGLHAMQEQSGLIGLQAGSHRIRIDFFENQGGAGLVASYEGPTIAKQAIPGLALSFTLPCAFDLDGNDAVDFSDLLELMAQWGPCTAECPADFNGDGDVGLADVLGMIGALGAVLIRLDVALTPAAARSGSSTPRSRTASGRR